jgi:hypothetical protein
MRANTALVCVAVAGVIAASGCSSGSSKAAAPSTTRRSSSPTSSVTARVQGPGSAITNPAASSPSSPSSASSPTTHAAPSTTGTVPPTPATPPTTAAGNNDEVAKAQEAVTTRGYTPDGIDDFSSPTPGGLHVIVATASGRADGHAQRAFFFIDGRFIGTDQKQPSATVKIAWRNDDTIALSYAAYKTGERLCCPSGGAIIVRYKWTGTRLKALDPIPPVSVRR